jgi:hypothetical protein
MDLLVISVQFFSTESLFKYCCFKGFTRPFTAFLLLFLNSALIAVSSYNPIETSVGHINS